MSEGFYTTYRMWKWPNAEIDVVARERFGDDDQAVISVQFSPWRKPSEKPMPEPDEPMKVKASPKTCELEPA